MYRIPCRPVGARLAPAVDASSQVVYLACDHIGGQDVAGRRPPRRIGADDDDVAGCEGQVEFGE
jgi:hypothetical protein